ncbi:hypothetical protein [Aliikangiella sp. G2MR2-5]|uniref:hypothetical protein n=1 Tax=Aliikangiella sp. G2MR2-5 TaxID=2788943 RepID=UPI0018AADF55|nr:hypothetical protein [Aliikangiella sp. G2MR2-5]
MSHKLDANELDSLELDGVGVVCPGMAVEHPMFGFGKVEAIYKFIKSDDITIRINFEEHGSKALAPEYANLSIPKVKKGIFGKLFGGSK